MKLLFTFIAGTVVAQLSAQNIKAYKRDSAYISETDRSTLKFANTVEKPVAVPFRSIICKDVRYDTSQIGASIKVNGFIRDRSFERVSATPGDIQDHLSKLFSFSTDTIDLVCFLKQFRFTDDDSASKNEDGLRVCRRVRFSTESYLKKGDRYYPAFRIDTVVTSMVSTRRDFSILDKALDIFSIKASFINLEKCFRNRGYTLDEMEGRYLQRFDKPILNARSLNKGVYRSFAEFLNNQPSVTEYEFVKDKVATILYTKDQSGQMLPERQAFGFCDGNVIWINANNTFRPLIRRGNTFEFLAEYNISHGPTHAYVPMGSSVATLGASLLASALSDAMEDPSHKMLYQLNMESGEYY